MRTVRRYVNAGSLLVLGLITSCGTPTQPLAPLTHYCNKVWSFTRSGEASYSAFSDTKCPNTTAAHASAPGSPAAPLWPYAQPNSSTEIVVAWSDNSTNEDGFRVERSTDSGASWALVATTRGMRFTDRGRVSEQEACYRVSAFNGKGASLSSSPACTTPPAAPALLALVPISGDTLEIVWIDLSAVEDGYEVRYIDPGYAGQALLAVVPPDSTSVRATMPGSQYMTYYIYATKDGGYSDPSWGYLADVWEHRAPIGLRRIDGPVNARAGGDDDRRGLAGRAFVVPR